MTLRSCSHEAEIKRLLALGQWPHVASQELRAHAADCRSCADLILVSQAFRAALTAPVFS